MKGAPVMIAGQFQYKNINFGFFRYFTKKTGRRRLIARRNNEQRLLGFQLKVIEERKLRCFFQSIHLHQEFAGLHDHAAIDINRRLQD